MSAEHFDATHPSGAILFRSTRGGLMQGIQLGEQTMTAFRDADELAEAIRLTADVSHLKAMMEVREELITAGTPPSAAAPTRDDLAVAEIALRNHRQTTD
jgi:hypothetical protein